MTATSAITYRIGDYHGEGDHGHVWEIHDENGLAAELHVSVDRQEIMNIEVREDRRGEGLARRLYEAASEAMTVRHAPVAHRTEDGDAFAMAVGGPTAEYDCDCYGCTTADEDEE